MVILKNIGKAFGGFLFTIFLMGFIFTYLMSTFTSQNVLKPLFVSIVDQQFKQQINFTNEQRELLLQWCGLSKDQRVIACQAEKQFICFFSDEELEILCNLSDGLSDKQKNIILHKMLVVECLKKDNLTFGLENSTISIPCSIIQNATSDELPSILGETVFNNIYYKKYNCSFIECLMAPGGIEKYMIIISGYANNFFRSTMSYMLIGIVIGAVILFVCYESWYGRLMTAGKAMIISTIPYIFTILAINFLIPAGILSFIAPLTIELVRLMKRCLLIIFAIGATLIIVGYILKRYGKKKKITYKSKA